MTDFYIRAVLYFFCFLLSLYGLSALDFNRFLKKGRVVEGQILFFLLACSLAYLSGSLILAMIYHFYK